MSCKILDIIEKHGFEIGYKEGFEEGYKEGFEEGFNEGFEEAFNEAFEDGFEEECEKTKTLVSMLQEQNRNQDLKKAFLDKEYRQKLYREFGIA